MTTRGIVRCVTSDAYTSCLCENSLPSRQQYAAVIKHIEQVCMLDLLTVAPKFTRLACRAAAAVAAIDQYLVLLASDLISSRLGWTDARRFYDAYRRLCGPYNKLGVSSSRRWPSPIVHWGLTFILSAILQYLTFILFYMAKTQERWFYAY